MKLVITGIPGVGKHTSAKLVAKQLEAEVIDINRLAIDSDAVAEKTDRGLEVNVKKLTGLLAGKLKKNANYVIVGHLAPYVLKSAGIGMVAVLRRSPYDLEKTLENRGYSRQKVNENVASEILGISLYDSIETFGKRKVAEFDTTGKRPEQTAGEIVATFNKKMRRHAGSVDWLAVISDQDVQRFFNY